ncbi:MAG: hypothetical protein AAF492_08525 [Verrucomicrobiota bacterium]
MTRFATLLFACSLSLATARAGEIEVYFWQMTPEGDAEVGTDGRGGTRADLEDDLGYGSEEDVLGFRASIGKRHQLGIAGFNIDAKARNRIDRTIRFADNTFRVSENVTTSLDMQFAQVYYKYRLGHRLLNGGLIAGAQYIQIDAKATSDRLGSASEEVDAPMPIVGVFAQSQPIGMLRLRGNLIYSDFDIEDVEATYTEFEISAMLHVKNFFGGIGYRDIAIEAEEDSVPVVADISLTGPMAFIGMRW